MTGIPKISKMLKYPELLKYKKESEDHDERRRKQREDGWEKYSEMIKDKVSISGEEPGESESLKQEPDNRNDLHQPPAPLRSKSPAPVSNKDKKKITVGKNVDLFV